MPNWSAPLPVGRTNFSATCWFNTLCQLLKAIPELMKLLREAALSSNIAKSLVHLIDNPLEAPYDFLTEFDRQYPNVIVDEVRAQQCAYQFIDVFIYEIIAELEKANMIDLKNRISNLVRSRSREIHKCTVCNKINIRESVHSVIAMIPMIRANKDMPRLTWGESMGLFSTNQTQSTNITCETCKKPTQHDVWTKRGFMPPVMFIVAAESAGTPPLTYVVNLLEGEDVMKVTYALVATGNHGGDAARGTGGGHWYAHVLSGDKWYVANDSHVAEKPPVEAEETASDGSPRKREMLDGNVSIAVYAVVLKEKTGERRPVK